MTIINKSIVTLLSLVLLVSCNNHAKNQKANGLVQTKVKTYKVANGWAFSIYLGEKEYIRQPFIPGMPGKIPFATDSQAMEAGKLILGKMVTHKTPTISLEELKEHHLLPPAGNIQ